MWASYQVVVSVRSAAKGDAIISALPRELKAAASYEVVEDIAKENAFDEVIYLLTTDDGVAANQSRQ